MWQQKRFVEFFTFEMISWNFHHGNSIVTANIFIFSGLKKNLVTGGKFLQYTEFHQTPSNN